MTAGSQNPPESNLMLIFFDSDGEEVEFEHDKIPGDPIDFVSISQPGKYTLSIGLVNGPSPPYLKWGDPAGTGLFTSNPKATKSPFSPQGNSPFTAGVGAAFERQTFNELIAESFSSEGGVPIFFDREGNPFDEPQIYNKPNFVGPDVSALNNTWCD